MEKAPAIADAPGFTPPPLVHLRLPSGLEVVLIEKHTAPLVALSLQIFAGGTADPPGHAGLAALTAAMLTEGAGSRGAVALAEAIDQLGARIETFADSDATTISLLALRSRFARAAALFADVAVRPRFEPVEFERIRAEHLATLAQRRTDPDALASVVLQAALYQGTSYGPPVDGYPETIDRIALADLRRFHEARYRPENALLVVAGDITPRDLMTTLEPLFAKWRRGRATTPPAPEPARTGVRVVMVDKPSAPQSVIRIGIPTAPRAAPDYLALETVVTVLGGSFTSRLERNLRERHNYSYSANAHLAPRRGAGPLLAGADVHTEFTAPAVSEFRRELLEIRKPVLPEELVKAKALARQSLVGSMQSAAALAHLCGRLAAAGVAPDRYRTLDAELARLEIPDLERAALRYLDPSHAIIVIVGDLSKIRGPVEQVGLGPIEVWDSEGRPK
jgi:predicted Zn-dependent peptidase